MGLTAAGVPGPFSSGLDLARDEGADHATDDVGGLTPGFLAQVGVPVSAGELDVPEEGGDHLDVGTVDDGVAGKGMPKVVDADSDTRAAMVDVLTSTFDALEETF